MKINSHSRFEYRPRYYDERKERLEQIKAKYSGEHSKEHTRERIKGSFKNATIKNSFMRRGASSNITLLAIVVGLSALAWYFLYK